MRRLVVRGVMGGVVWVGGGGRRCRAWGPVMGSLVAVAGGGDSRWRVSAGVSTSIGWCWLPRVVSVAWSRGGGGGGGGVGVALLVVGGAGSGVVLAGGLGVPVGRVDVACVRRAALAVLDWLWCRGVGGRRPHERPDGAVVRM